jgi:hypothetical protein
VTGACIHAELAGDILNEEVFKLAALVFDPIYRTHNHIDLSDYTRLLFC